MKPRMIRPDGFQHMDWIGPLFVLFVVALLVIGAILVTRTIVNSRGATTTGPSAASGPLRILEERFARGEIDDEEFRRRRDLLRG